MHLMKRLEKFSSAMLSDSLRGMHTLDSGIQSITPGVRITAPAFTVLAEAGSIITVHKALLEAPPGVVLIVGGETGKDLNGALFGKLMAVQARQQGIVGVVVDGPVRDVAELREMAFPVFARCATPRVGLNRRVGDTQLPVPCGGIIVNPGDFVCADEDGVTIVPNGMAEEVIGLAEQQLRKETDIERRIAEGEHITDMINFTTLIYG